MRENAHPHNAAPRRTLYPSREPFDQQFLDMPGGHRVYLEQSGKVDGVPVVVLHGGPGGGCSPAMRRFFDPHFYRSVLFDQRGCGRSSPQAEISNNTTWDLVADIERIREHLGIERWYVFGGSWGATLALIYAQAHPERVMGLILRGVFLMTQGELDWFYEGGVSAFFPEEWERFQSLIPVEERGDMIAAYHRRLFGADRAEQVRYARAWAAWESNLAALSSPGRSTGGSGEYARAFARLENHYFTHHGWLNEDTAILSNTDKLRGIPGYIVQGRYDMICPPRSAYALHRAWPDSDLRMIGAAGHALSEPGIAAELVSIMDELR
ncbi:proline iminopeptidase [Rubricella aquisinus]|uniref:Proline iminopeptidase n=1 Tax=Rubricella aquisinus TaxID=2028108 RepID=A0A840WVP8_9RHOB|nr:prolyl aminopeptidase [Rubricella aquisinus]MBB5514324.1 proline iminopeptidase [Rubricella aquisinus]